MPQEGENKNKTVRFNIPEEKHNMELDENTSPIGKTDILESVSNVTIQHSEVKCSSLPPQNVEAKATYLVTKESNAVNSDSPPLAFVTLTHAISPSNNSESSSVKLSTSPPLFVQEVDIHSTDVIHSTVPVASSDASGLVAVGQSDMLKSSTETSDTSNCDSDDQSSGVDSLHSRSTTSQGTSDPLAELNPWEKVISTLGRMITDLSRAAVGSKHSTNSHLEYSGNKAGRFKCSTEGQPSPLASRNSTPNNYTLKDTASLPRCDHQKTSICCIISGSCISSDLEQRRMKLEEEGLTHRDTLRKFAQFLLKECDRTLQEVNHERVRDFMVYFEVFREEYDRFQMSMRFLQRDWDNIIGASVNTLQNLRDIHDANERAIARVQYAFFMIRIHLNMNGTVRQVSNRIRHLAELVRKVEQWVYKKSDSGEE